jgi:tRNA modification GTPase
VTDSLQISALTGAGITELKEQLVSCVLGDFNIQEETIVSNARHFESLQKTDEALSKAQEGLHIGTTGDFIALDIRTAMRHLGNITGHIYVDTDILGSIFSKFCIGK